MKFSIKHAGKSGRMGIISGLKSREVETYETPLLTLHTRGGNVPHITHEVLQLVTTENMIMHMPLNTVMTASSSIESFGRGIAAFVGLSEYPSYITPQDPASETLSGYNVSDKIAMWTKNGKRTVNPSQYMSMMEKMQPDMYVALCDGDTESDSSKKRVIKSVARTSKLFRDCYRVHQESKALQHVALLAPIEGGYDLNARRLCSEEMACYDVNGFVFDGLHTNGPKAEKITFSSIERILKECLNRLPEEKLRVIHGAWNPITVIHLVAAGFDMFDTSLPYICTERSCALIFPYKPEMVTPNPAIVSTKSVGEKTNVPVYDLCLDDVIHAEEFQPILKECNCVTCKQHTRAYIYHLLKSQELLGKVLIMMHNLHHYLEFFKSIRRATQNDTLNDLRTLVESSGSSL